MIFQPIRAIKKDMRGDRRLKKQKGAYRRVGTDRMVAWVMPQLDQGKRGEVTVAESSTVRLRRRGS